MEEYPTYQRYDFSRDPNAGERKRQPTNQGLDLETNTAMRWG